MSGWERYAWARGELEFAAALDLQGTFYWNVNAVMNVLKLEGGQVVVHAPAA